MIVQVSGKLVDVTLPFAVIDVQGMGYQVEMPHSCWYALPPLGETLTLYTSFVVREDAQLLFGFMTRDKRDVFNEIRKISGVGPKLALTILSSLTVTELVQIIQQQNPQALVAIKGVGTKVAQRLVLDLKGKLDGWQGTALPSVNAYQEEAIAALMALGYSQNQAEKTVAKITDAKDTESLIRSALQRMAT